MKRIYKKQTMLCFILGIGLILTSCGTPLPDNAADKNAAVSGSAVAVSEAAVGKSPVVGEEKAKGQAQKDDNKAVTSDSMLKGWYRNDRNYYELNAINGIITQYTLDGSQKKLYQKELKGESICDLWVDNENLIYLSVNDEKMAISFWRLPLSEGKSFDTLHFDKKESLLPKGELKIKRLEYDYVGDIAERASNSPRILYIDKSYLVFNSFDDIYRLELKTKKLISLNKKAGYDGVCEDINRFPLTVGDTIFYYSHQIVYQLDIKEWKTKKIFTYTDDFFTPNGCIADDTLYIEIDEDIYQYLLKTGKKKKVLSDTLVYELMFQVSEKEDTIPRGDFYLTPLFVYHQRLYLKGTEDMDGSEVNEVLFSCPLDDFSNVRREAEPASKEGKLSSWGGDTFVGYYGGKLAAIFDVYDEETERHDVSMFYCNPETGGYKKLENKGKVWSDFHSVGLHYREVQNHLDLDAD